jgi:outer membrane protein TolC
VGWACAAPPLAAAIAKAHAFLTFTTSPNLQRAVAFGLAKERYRLGLSGQIPMLPAEATLLEARQQMTALVAQAANQRVTLLLSVGGGFAREINSTQGATP